MRAQTIQWHEQCLKNQLRYLAEKEAELSSKSEEVERIRKQSEKYKAQIKQAKELHKQSFDSDRFLKNKIVAC